MLKQIDYQEYKNQIKYFNDYNFHYSAKHNYHNIVYKNSILYGYYQNNKAVILLRGISIRIFKKFKILVFSFGPILRDKNVTQKVFNSFIDNLKKEIKDKKYIFTQIYPTTSNHKMQKYISSLLENNNSLVKSKMKFSWTDGTMLLDITNDLNSIKKNFRKGTRYNLKKIKKEKRLQLLISNSEKSINDFFKLYATLEKEKNFKDPAIPFYKKIIRDDIGKLFLVYEKEILISGILAVKFIETNSVIIYLQCSNKTGLKLLAPTFLVWEVIKWAKKKNFSKIDFFTYSKQMESVNKFKRGFRPKLLLYPTNAYDLIANYPLYYLFMLKKRL